MLLDDLIDQLTGLGIKPDFATLPADQGRDVFKLVEFAAPGLPMGNGFVLQRTSAPGAISWVRHFYSFLRVHGSTHRKGSYRWTVII
jgi:hypothetical protein